MNAWQGILLSFLLKIVIYVASFAPLFYWSSVAIKKYSSQPISTYTTYTRGDDDKKVMFPHISFCQIIPNGLKQCRQSPTDNFLTLIQTCLKNDTNFDINEYMKNSTIDVSEFANAAILDAGNDVQDLRSLFYQRYHPKYGPCIEFDAKELQLPIEMVNEFTQLNFQLNFQLLGEVFTKVIIFHSEQDGSAEFHQRIAQPPGYTTDVYLKKKVTIRDSTEKSPCGDFKKEPCQEVKGNQQIIQQLKCKVPFLFPGRYLKAYIDGYDALPNCEEKQVLAKAMDIFMNVSKDCQQIRACKETKYTVTSRTSVYNSYTKPFYLLDVQYSDLEVEHDISTINYDVQSLICEIGGLIGMTLGFSALSVGNLMINFFSNSLSHS